MKKAISHFIPSLIKSILAVVLFSFTFSVAKAEYVVVNAGPSGGCCCSVVCYKKVHVKHYRHNTCSSYVGSSCGTRPSPYEVSDYAWSELGGDG